MFNSYGFIKLGINRKGIKEELDKKYDKLDAELIDKVLKKLEAIKNKNEIINYNIISMNNLDGFLNVQISRNHFNTQLREFYTWISEISNGSHGVLYEVNDEETNHNPNKPYKVWRLVGEIFEEVEETLLNEKFYKVNY